uniref:Putative ovule protein n=1 Tax=Solanum chacoense TaxID=4108 RepID=A0A0V0H5G4_SOLCH
MMSFYTKKFILVAVTLLRHDENLVLGNFVVYISSSVHLFNVRKQLFKEFPDSLNRINRCHCFFVPF